MAQELLASQGSGVFYWSRNSRSSSSEVDFLVEIDNKIVPLEVKSGKGGSLRSMRFMLEAYSDCLSGMVLYSGTFSECQEQNISYIPLYYAGTLLNKD